MRIGRSRYYFTKRDAEASRAAAAAMVKVATQGNEKRSAVYLVVTENGIFDAVFDRNRALEMAHNVGAVVATVPILIDFRGTEIDPDTQNGCNSPGGCGRAGCIFC